MRSSFGPTVSRGNPLEYPCKDRMLAHDPPKKKNVYQTAGSEKGLDLLKTKRIVVKPRPSTAI